MTACLAFALLLCYCTDLSLAIMGVVTVEAVVLKRKGGE